MGRPVTHFEIAGRNGKELQDFYSKLFDWKIDDNNTMNYGMVDVGDQGGIGGGIAATSEPAPASYVTVYVQVDDIEEHLKKAESLGGKTLMPSTPTMEGGPTVAMFSDPAGNMMGLFKEPSTE